MKTFEEYLDLISKEREGWAKENLEEAGWSFSMSLNEEATMRMLNDQAAKIEELENKIEGLVKLEHDRLMNKIDMAKDINKLRNK